MAGYSPDYQFCRGETFTPAKLATVLPLPKPPMPSDRRDITSDISSASSFACFISAKTLEQTMQTPATTEALQVSQVCNLFHGYSL